MGFAGAQPVKILRAKFEIVPMSVSAPPIIYGVLSLLSIWPCSGRIVSAEADSAKPLRLVEPTLDSWFALARATEPCHNAER